MGLVQLGRGILASKHISYLPAGEMFLEREKSSYYLSLRGLPTITLSAGASEGETLVSGGRLKANQSAVINLGSVAPNKYHLKLVLNPQLYNYGLVHFQDLLEPLEGNQDLLLHLHTKKEFDPNGVRWWARVYALE